MQFARIKVALRIWASYKILRQILTMDIGRRNWGKGTEVRTHLGSFERLLLVKVPPGDVLLLQEGYRARGQLVNPSLVEKLETEPRERDGQGNR